MVTIEQQSLTTQKIAASSFPSNLKDRLTSILSSLDEQTLNVLSTEIVRGDGVLVAEKTTALWERFAKVLGGFRQNDSRAKDDFFRLFNEALETLNDEHKLFVLSLIVDARRLAENKTVIFSEQEMEKLLDYEVSLLRHLPPEEIGFFLERHAVSTLGKINLVKEIQVAAADQDWSEQSDVFMGFSDALLRNQEIIIPGTKKTVALWLREFISFNEVPLSKKTSLHSAEFIVKQPTLRPEEKLLLSSILSLFLWCRKPMINFDELSSYRQEVEAQKLRYYEILYEASQNGSEAATPKYWWQVPAPKIPTTAPYYRAERITVPAPPLRQPPSREATGGHGGFGGQAPSQKSDVRSQMSDSRGQISIVRPPTSEFRVPKKLLPPPPRPPVVMPPVQKSEVRSQISTPSSSPPYQEGEREGTKPAPRPPASPPPPPRTPPQPAEQLYKSTLEELQKMREEERDLAQRAKSFSVNTAVARAGAREGDGQVVAGDDRVEKKLEELEKKVDSDPNIQQRPQ